ncbi:MAG: NRDE family protein [Blastocatellales bacterium]
MCTVSWIHGANGYELFCNRDELLTRKPASPPRTLKVGGVQIIAPRDGDFGGSWISANEFGLSLSLLNLYNSGVRQAGSFISRGLLLMSLSESRSQDQLIERIAVKRMNQFQPFTLLAMEPGKAALIVTWDGNQCLTARCDEMNDPLTSSSFDSARVIEVRKENFRRLANSSGTIDSRILQAFHSSHEPAAGAYSTCMHREDAATVSLSHIKVDPDSIEFQYFPCSPCRKEALGISAEIQTLLRRK